MYGSAFVANNETTFDSTFYRNENIYWNRELNEIEFFLEANDSLKDFAEKLSGMVTRKMSHHNDEKAH